MRRLRWSAPVRVGGLTVRALQETRVGAWRGGGYAAARPLGIIVEDEAGMRAFDLDGHLLPPGLLPGGAAPFSERHA